MPETQEQMVDANQQAPTEDVAPSSAEQPATETASNGGAGSNINSLNLEDQVDDSDPEADMDAIVLPPDGVITLKLKAGNKGVYGPTKDKDGNLLDSPKIDKQGAGFFVADLEIHVVSEDPRYDGIRVFHIKDATQPAFVNSMFSPRTRTSSAADIANKTGYPFQKGASVGAKADHFRQLLASEPTIKGVLQWQAAKETGETDERGYAVRRVALRGMKSFPQLVDKEGNVVYHNGNALHNPRTEDPQDGTELVAQAVITRFLPVS